jgi:hypothetical protein
MDAGDSMTVRRIDLVFQIAMLLLVANGYLAILLGGELDSLSAAVMAIGLVVRGLSILGWGRSDLPKPLIATLSLLYVAFYLADIFVLRSGFMISTVRMLFFFTALRLVTARTSRDYFYLGVLAFLHLMAASMFVGGVSYLAVLLLFLIFSILTYTAFEIRRGCQAAALLVEDADQAQGKLLWVRLATLSIALSGGILMLSFALFLVIPRTLALSSISPLRGNYTVGFSDQVNLGNIGSVQLDHTPVMRIRESSGASLEKLKWRGLALRHFSGTRWSNPSPQDDFVEPNKGQYLLRAPVRRNERGRRIRYAVALEPMPVSAMFLAGQPEQISGSFRSLHVTDTDSYRVPRQPHQPLRYQAESWIPGELPERAANVAELFTKQFRGKYLQLPKLDSRVATLAKQITGASESPLRQAALIEQHLRGQFGYTLNLPETKVGDPLAHFLFERREGHCEYFASAMTVMLRTLGISARLVNGFLEGIYNPVSEEQVIRSSDAHSWVEAYIPGHGWLSFDPTPPSPYSAMGFWAMQFWMYWDALESSWGAWVLDYDWNRQLSLARDMQGRSQLAAGTILSSIQAGRRWAAQMWAAAGAAFEQPGARRQTGWLMLLALIAAAAGLALGLPRLAPWLARVYRRRRVETGHGRISDATYFYEQALRILECRGFNRLPTQTADEFAESVQEPQLRGLVQQVTKAYNRARFGHDRAQEKRLPQLVQALDRSR